MSLTRDEAIKILEKDQPNLAAILIGCVSGKFTEWPLMRPELIALVTEHETLRSELEQVTKGRDEAREIVAQANNALIGSYGYFTEPSFINKIEELKRLCNQYYNQLTGANATIERLYEEADIREKTITELEDSEAMLKDRLASIEHDLDVVSRALSIREDDCEVERLARGIDNIQREIRS